MSTAHIKEAQKLAPDALVELFSLDTTQLTNIYGVPGQGDVLNFCPGSLNGSSVAFNGVTYQPMPIEGSGFEWSGQGKLPRPMLKVANISGLAGGLTYQYADLLGATVTRIRTFARFLDGQPGADPTASFEPDVFRIDRKSHQNKTYVEFELAAAFDQQGLRLPRRQALRDACSYTYRVFTQPGVVHYGTCPYAGLSIFDEFDQPSTDVTKDKCSHRLTGCLKRYGAAPLPFAGFPGIAQTANG